MRKVCDFSLANAGNAPTHWFIEAGKIGPAGQECLRPGGFKEPTFYIWRAKYGGIEALKGDLGVRRASATGQAQGLRQDARSPSAHPAVLWDCRAMPGAYVTRILDQAARFKG